MSRLIKEVGWRIDSNYYPMMRVRPIEIIAARKQRPGFTGIPYMYALFSNGEVDWFPDSMRGEPIVTTEVR